MIPVFALIIPFTGLAIGIYLLYRGTDQYLALQKIWNTPTSKAASAAMGLVELYGETRSTKPLESHITKKECVYSKVVGDYYDSMRQRWRQFFVLERAAPFILEDASGTISVDPSQATVNIKDQTYEGHLFRGKEVDPLNVFFGSVKEPVEKRLAGVFDFIFPAQKITPRLPTSSDERVAKFISESKEFPVIPHNIIRVKEFVIPTDAKVYVLGDAQLKGNRLVVGKSSNYRTILIADEKEKFVDVEFRTRTATALIIGFIFSVLSLLILFSILGML